MADRHRRVSRGALTTVDDCPFSASSAEKDGKAQQMVEHEDVLLDRPSNGHGSHEESHPGGNLFSAILSRWLMSNALYSSSVNSMRFK